MEHAPTIGTYVAYALLWLFLLLLTAAIARSGMLLVALVVLPFVRRSRGSADADGDDQMVTTEE